MGYFFGTVKPHTHSGPGDGGALDLGSTLVGTDLLGNFLHYRRPVLTYDTASRVIPEAGLTGVAGERVILFPDADYRIDSTASHYQMDLTRNAVLSGTKQGGLRTGLSETANQWYAVYAVKATDNITDFVLVGDTLLPLPVNYAALNSNFGTSGWEYLGMIRNGDGAGLPSDILYFVQTGNTTNFYNSLIGGYGDYTRGGIRLATNGGTTSMSYLESQQGTGALQWPNNWPMCYMMAAYTPTGANAQLVTRDYDALMTYDRIILATVDRYLTDLGLIDINNGLKLVSSTSSQMDLHLTGGIDTALGVGPNPLL